MKKYNTFLENTPLSLPREVNNRKHIYHLYVVRVQERDKPQKYLTDAGIGTGIHYKVPIHLQDACKFYGYKAGGFPQAERVSREILSLPIYPELRDEDVNYITDTIRAFYA